MLQQTREQKQELVNKIQLMEFISSQLSTVHVDKEDKDKLDSINKRVLAVSDHKLKLLDELARLSNVEIK